MMLADVASASPFMSMIASLGSAAAAVVVVYLFMGYIRDSAKRQEAMYERLTLEFGRVAADKAEVIHGVAVALDNNTKAIHHLEETVITMIRQLESRASRS